MTIAQFRKAFPEFADVAQYPDAQISFYIALANANVSLDTYGVDVWPLAQNLFVAHNLATSRSQAGGPTSSKTVGSVSVSYDTNMGSYKDAGWYNLSNYGKQYWNLMMMYGAGCVQL